MSNTSYAIYNMENDYISNKIKFRKLCQLEMHKNPKSIDNLVRSRRNRRNFNFQTFLYLDSI